MNELVLNDVDNVTQRLMLTLACAKMFKALEAWNSLNPQGSNPSINKTFSGAARRRG
jgi:hypothetical protein